jgi:sec-independent protein translocase protein TatC
MSFGEHLREFRVRIVRIILALILGFFACWSFRVELFDLLAGPISQALADNGIYQFQAIQITESILVYLKTSFLFAAILTSPYTFYQLWAFVAPAFHEQEKVFIVPVTAFTVIFFLIGMGFAYQIILPFITDWLVKLTLEGGQVGVMVTLQNAYSTAFVFLVMFGLVFELPLVIFFLSLFGLVTTKGLIRFFRYFVVLSVILGAILTPPDPISQALMAVPLNLLYAFGILISWGVERSRKTEGEGVSTGVTLTRLVGSSLLLLALAAFLVAFFMRVLPARELTSFVPRGTNWVVGFNPAYLSQVDQLQGAMRKLDIESSWPQALQEGQVDASTVRHAVFLGGAEDTHALIVRGDDLASLEGSVREALNDKKSAFKGVRLAVLDEHTMALGDESLVKSIEKTTSADAHAYSPSDAENLLLTRLKTAGPLWAWLPRPAASDTHPLGPKVGADAAATGAAVQVADALKLGIHVVTDDRSRADALEAHLDEQLHAMSQHRNQRQQKELVDVMQGVVTEMKRQGGPQASARLAHVEQELSRLSPLHPTSSDTLLHKLSLSSGRWNLKRNDTRMELKNELQGEILTVWLKQALDLMK